MNAAIYLRLSRDEEQEGIDKVLFNHRNELIKLAEGNNLQYDIYQEVSSGMNSNRPELNRLINNIELYDFVLCMDIDRITRDNVLAEQLKRIFIMNEVKILTPTGEFDFDNESNDLLYSFSSLLANYEWKQIRKRMSKGRLAAAGQGRWVVSNKVPLGYKKDEDQKLVIVEEEAKVIRFIFDKLINGYSANRITKELDLLNWKTKQGTTITTSHISAYKKNPVYYGVVSMKRRINGRIVDEVFVENAHDPIIDKETFMLAQKVYKETSSQFKFRQRGNVNRRLHGLIFCAKCGRKRYIQKDGKGVNYVKKCSNKVDSNRCEDAGMRYIDVEESILSKLIVVKQRAEEELKKLETNDYSDRENSILNQINALTIQLNKLSTRKKNLLIMRTDGEVTKQEFEELKKETDEKIKQTEKDLELLKISLESVSNVDEEIVKLKYIIDTLDKLHEMDILNVNTFLKTLIKKIRVSSNVTKKSNSGKVDVKPTIRIEFINKSLEDI